MKQKGKGLILKMPRRPMTRAFVARMSKGNRPIVEQKGGVLGTLAASLLASAVGGLISEIIKKKRQRGYKKDDTLIFLTSLNMKI